MAVIVPSGMPSADGNPNVGYRNTKYPGKYEGEKGPLRILIFNIMPDAIATEKHFIDILTETGYDIELTFMITATYQTKRVPEGYFDKYYLTLDELKELDVEFDGIMYTGAPLGFVHFDDVFFKDEWIAVADWGEANVNANLFICWSAFAYYYYRFGLWWDEYEKMGLYNGKISGIYPNYILKEDILFEGMNNPFPAPHSRERGTSLAGAQQLEAEGKLKLMVTCETGAVISKITDSKTFLNLCHLEYDQYRLDDEGRRDNFSTGIPQNYYENDDTETEPTFCWHEDGVIYYTNWIKHYVATDKDTNRG